jgi:hypothetical protein
MFFIAPYKLKSPQLLILLLTILLAATNSFAAISKANNEKNRLDKTTSTKIFNQLRQNLCNFKKNADGKIYSSTIDGDLVFESNSASAVLKNGKSWFGLNLSGYGRGTQISQTIAQRITSSGTTLNKTYKNITEWYKNKGTNIEHGLVLNKKPCGNGNLNFYFTTSGNLEPQMKGQNIVFSGKDAISYSGMKAWDAKGKKISCAMKISDDKLVWTIDDDSAEYPITIDPTISSIKELTNEGLAQKDYFGGAVAVSKDTIMVSAQNHAVNATNYAGIVYVFSKDEGGTDNWGLSQKLAPEQPFEYGSFGDSLSISDNIAVIGAGRENYIGAAYVYSKDNNGKWALDPEYGTNGRIAPPLDGSLRFGSHVSISEGTIAIGAPSYKEDHTYSVGIAFIYKPGDSEPKTIKYYDQSYQAESNSFFGASISISHNTLAVGAYGTGKVYIFSRQDDTWRRTAEISGNESDIYFGYAVSVDNGTLAISDPGRINTSDDTTKGSVYLYNNDNGQWKLTKKIVALTDDGEVESDVVHFGQSVSVHGSKLVVGAPGKLGDRHTSGKAYIFFKRIEADGSINWPPFQKIYPENSVNSVNHDLGSSVSVFDNIVVAGEPSPNDGQSQSGVGLAFVCQIPEDSDSDGLKDSWEQGYFGNLDQTADGDYDNDGVSNYDEFLEDTNPANAEDFPKGAELDITATIKVGEDVTSIVVYVDGKPCETSFTDLGNGQYSIEYTLPYGTSPTEPFYIKVNDKFSGDPSSTSIIIKKDTINMVPVFHLLLG